MKNSVTERIPYQWYEIDAIEGWLDEHVRQGLRLVNITPLKRAEFEPATGSLTRYRIHVKEEKDGSRDEEYHETFRELGWEFVAELNDQADIYQAIRPDALGVSAGCRRAAAAKEAKQAGAKSEAAEKGSRGESRRGRKAGYREGAKQDAA